MIGYLRGRVISLEPQYALLEVNGVGYEVEISGAAHAKLSQTKAGEQGELFTFLQVREDAVSLFGFADLTEKALFLKLTSVQGVGAKTALSILSALSPRQVSDAISGANPGAFASVKGVGKKTADRIILELHGKIGADKLLSLKDTDEKGTFQREDDEAISALMGLGFTNKESARAVERAKEEGAKTVEDIISLALRGM